MTQNDVRAFYDSFGEREWVRLAQSADGAVEFAITRHTLVTKAQAICGHLAGSPVEIEEAMNFAAANGVTSWVERLPLADVNEAVTRLREGHARFRIVLEPGVTGD